MHNALKNFVKNFIRCGLTGWCLEISFTAANALRRRDFRLQGTTSLWMFPIYGCAAFLKPLCRLLQNKPAGIRGCIYMSLIFGMEYLSGIFLKRHTLCPWDYSHSRWHIRQVIRLDYAPYWFGAGLLFEQLLCPASHHQASPVTLHSPADSPARDIARFQGKTLQKRIQVE